MDRVDGMVKGVKWNKKGLSRTGSDFAYEGVFGPRKMNVVGADIHMKGIIYQLRPVYRGDT